MASLNRSTLQRLAESRLEDAKVLLGQQRYDAAFYLSGYAVECGLKACVAKQTQLFDFPDKGRVNKSWTHDLHTLAGLSKLPEALDFANDKDLEKNWSLVSATWSEESRYENHSQIEAENLYNAIAEPNHGVFQWLQKYW